MTKSRRAKGEIPATLFGKPRAALYHRVSTSDQDPELARAELRAAAERMGFEVGVDIEEVGSGARNDRPGLQTVMTAARRGQVAAVFVWKLDRFGRSSLDLQANIQALKDAGVRFVAITQGLDVKPAGDAMSNLILSVLAGVAEFERTIIRERTMLGLAKARAKGKRLGRRPVLDVDGEAVRRLRLEGRSWAEVAGEVGCSVAAARRADAAALARAEAAGEDRA